MEKLEFLAGFSVRLVLFVRLWYAICESAVGKQHAVCSSLGFIKRGELLEPPCFNFIIEGGLAMVTYSDLIQTGILIVTVIDVVLRLIEAERNRK